MYFEMYHSKRESIETALFFFIEVFFIKSGAIIKKNLVFLCICLVYMFMSMSSLLV